ncbi:MAG: hypothetical protein ACRCSK_08050 [Fusobacteriaceae bacterium]
MLKKILIGIFGFIFVVAIILISSHYKINETLSVAVSALVFYVCIIFIRKK